MNRLLYQNNYILKRMSNPIKMRFCMMHNCYRSECKNKHIIDNRKDRLRMKKLFKLMYDDEKHAEEEIETFGRDEQEYVNCFYGPLCSRADCYSIHNCSYEFRLEFIQKWKEL